MSRELRVEARVHDLRAGDGGDDDDGDEEADDDD